MGKRVCNQRCSPFCIDSGLRPTLAHFKVNRSDESIYRKVLRQLLFGRLTLFFNRGPSSVCCFDMGFRTILSIDRRVHSDISIRKPHFADLD